MLVTVVPFVNITCVFGLESVVDSNLRFFLFWSSLFSLNAISTDNFSMVSCINLFFISYC